jgi:hypothetical protein
MKEITNVPYSYNGIEYIIKISFEDGDFIFQIYIDDEPVNGTLRANVLQAITGYMENGKQPFDDELTVIKDNIIKNSAR